MFLPESRALNYSIYALIQHICSLNVADFQQICSDYAVDFKKGKNMYKKPRIKLLDYIVRLYLASNYHKVSCE